MATTQIWRGALPYVGLQLGMIGLVAAWPELATALPRWLYGA